MGQVVSDLRGELSRIEQEIASTDDYNEISNLNIRAMELKRELGLPLDN